MLIFFNLILSYKYYIKHPDSKTYLQSIRGVNSSMFFGNKETRNKFRLEFSKESNLHRYIFIDDFSNQVLDYVQPSNKIISFNFTGTENQKFELRLYNCINRFSIAIEQNKCLTYNKATNLISFEQCTFNNKMQIFEFICVNCNINGESINDQNRNSQLKEGFYDEEIMAILHKIENMTQELTDCFVMNSVCGICPNTGYNFLDTPFSQQDLVKMDEVQDKIANTNFLEKENLFMDLNDDIGLHHFSSGTNFLNNLLNNISKENAKKLQDAIYKYKKDESEIKSTLRSESSAKKYGDLLNRHLHPIHLIDIPHKYGHYSLQTKKPDQNSKDFGFLMKQLPAHQHEKHDK